MRGTPAFTCLFALIAIGCAGRLELPDSPQKNEAVRAGYDRGNELSTARACGVDPGLIDGAARSSTSTQFTDPSALRTYRETMLVWMRQPFTISPTSDRCDALRRNPEFAQLAPVRGPLSESREIAEVADRQATPLKATDTNARAAADTAPSYCAEGSLALELDSSLDAGLTALRAKCRVGDTVIMPAFATGVIASACDLSKPVAAAGRNVFCTLGRIRPIRRGGS